MKANKTQPTVESVSEYLLSIEDPQRKSDAIKLTQLMEEATNAKPIMWGTSIVGFGKNHYVYLTGREGDTAAVGFSARKQALVLYGVIFYEENEENVILAKKLGKYAHGKGCIYIKKLSDINIDILKKMIYNAYIKRANV